MNPTKDQELAVDNVRLEKISRWNTRSNSRKNVDVRDLSRSSADEYKLKKPKNSSTDTSKFDKVSRFYLIISIVIFLSLYCFISIHFLLLTFASLTFTISNGKHWGLVAKS